ncbi:MAG: ATP-binding protein [Cyanobacteria bacterium J06555_13]
MTNTTAKFVAHARLKDIVGRGLINNDNTAIIELIKNSKDAQSKSVDIFFADARKASKESLIVIQDFGKGMNIDDLQYKWLNIAYSEKKNSQPSKDEAYAGNKGIGRFACDRLGKTLSLFTRKRNGELLRLDIDWTDFEVDERDTQIGSIPTEITSVSFDEFAEETGGLDRFTQGTTLVVRDLRSNWPKGRLNRLKKELERFVFDPKRQFTITLHAEDYEDDDELNGEVQNKIFDKLDFRTTSIVADVPAGGDKIEIALRHDGEEVFSITERNPYRNLSDVKITVFFLNQAAKAFFRRQTGYRSINYGSIFLFLNGFRVMPYGEESDDWLALDQRKAQGIRRYLSTRDLVGYIEIVDRHGAFQVVSSREGLVHNVAFNELTSESRLVRSAIDDELLYGLFHKVFRKLERFVVDGLDWDRLVQNFKDTDDLDEKTLKRLEYRTTGRKIFDTMIPAITIRTPKDHVIDVDVNMPHLVHMAEEEIASYDEFVDSLQERFKDVTVAKLTPSDNSAVNRT